MCQADQILSRQQVSELAHELPESAVFPKVVERFLVGVEVSRNELLAALPAARAEAGDSDRVLELLLLIENRLQED